MRRPLRSKKQCDVAFAMLIVLLLGLCFLYMMWVFSHLSSIQARHQPTAKQQEDENRRGGEELQRKRLYADEDIEGGVDLAGWESLQSQGKSKKSAQPQVTLPPVQDPPALVEDVKESADAVKPHDSDRIEKEQHINPNPTPIPSVPNDGDNIKGATPPTVGNVHVHARPLTTAERLYETQLLPREGQDADHSALESNPLLRQYIKDPKLDGSYEDIEQSFFQQNGHIFSHIPLAKKWFQLWVQLNKDMRSGKRPARYVLVRPVGQLCNRLMAITSGALLAMITKRGLIVDDGGFYCSLNDLFDTPGFDWLNPGTAPVDLSHATYISNPESGVWEETEKLLCSHDFATVYPQPHIDLSINQFLIPYLTRNPTIGPQLAKLFRGQDTLFYPLSHFLFRPIEKLVQLRDQVVRKHFANAKAVIGLQLRSGGDFTDHFMSQEDFKLYKDCAEVIAQSPSNGVSASSAIVFFVATDTAKGREAALKYLSGPNHRVVFGPTDFLLSNYPEGVQMALLDLLLLAAADDRVTTAWSSYGYFAAGYSGTRASMVVDEVPKDQWIASPGQEQRFMGVAHKSDKRRQCVRLPMFQPCFHKFESWGASRTTCYSTEMRDKEMLNGRYC